MKRRVAIILPSLCNGGAEIAMVRLAHELTMNPEYDVCLVICANRQSDDVIIPPISLRAILFPRRHVSHSFFDLVKLFRQEKFDIVVSSLEHATVMVDFALRLTGSIVAFLPIVHNTLSISLHQSDHWMDRVVWQIAKDLYQRMTLNSQGLIGVVSCGVGKDLQKTAAIPADKIRILYNPVVLNDQQNEQKVEDMSYHLPEGALLTVGRLEPEKGFDLLIRAYALIKEKINNPLYILGGGSQRRILQELINKSGLQGRVILAGYVHNAASVMHQASLFVLSSRVEGLPTVLIEALAAGLPVIATDCMSGPREILGDGLFGTLVPAENPGALAEAILVHGSKPHDVDASKKRAMEFSVESSIKAYIRVFDELLALEPTE